MRSAYKIKTHADAPPAKTALVLVLQSLFISNADGRLSVGISVYVDTSVATRHEYLLEVHTCCTCRITPLNEA